ncbi:HAMP domain-containing histidine kinase [Streptococcus mutans]|nr:HAMP domain-containing histidine kinase [Streptococcus mutans]NLQ86841.1 HAMP domain-containing histidine kinase [Streptococcus mutans]NLQ93243.1 HAMP domain-containing histidine kinase [Streptococcus mutans]NLR02078.1 HAMP domain-containing histidine kinase [Streptococcus mutans]QGU41303.1 HAMP domain-containing histidine kinase [Streptococcus mutans]
MSMFRKIRFRFILVASFAILCILISFVGVFNSVRYVQNNDEINAILTILSRNKGEFPDPIEINKEVGNRGLSVAVINQYQYYSFIVDRKKDTVSLNLSHISHLTEEQAESYMRNINLHERDGRFRKNNHFYSYRVTKMNPSGRYLVVVLDATRFFADRSELINLSIQMAFYSLLFFILVVSVFSGYAIKPYLENYEKQKRFITNAGHELKTPLSIISANNELQELMTGETEWTKSTKDQVERLTHLINQLVTLARLEEQPNIVLERVCFSEIVQDAAEDFKAPIIKDGKTFEMQIASDIYVKAEEKSLFELVTLLVDNANKYCDDKGTVSVKLSRTSGLKKARLEVSNTFKEGTEIDYSRFFDRFYREDESHNNQTSGYGIGLSMAQSIVKIFKGKISVSYKNDAITFKVIL